MASGDVFVGTNTIKVAIHNNRSIPIENLELTYQLNHHPEVVESWSGHLAPFDSIIYTFETPVQINRGRTYNLKTSVHLADQTEDLNLNNNVTTHTTTIPMFGTFLIGQNGFTDYPDIREATLDMVYSAGVGGPITFEVQEGTGYELLASTNAFSTLIYNEHPIIIRGIGETPSDVVCIGNPLRRIKNLRIEHMTILPNSMQGLYIYEMPNLAFENCIFIGVQEMEGRESGLSIRDSDHLTIKNCHFENFIQGISFLGNSGANSSSFRFRGVIKIEDCTFDNHDFAAISVSADMDTDSMIIHNNQITNTQEYGIYVKPDFSFNLKSIQVTNNRIYNAETGVLLSDVRCGSGDCPRNLVANNMIHATTAFGMNQDNDAFDVVSNSFMGNVSIAGEGTNFFNNSLFQNNDISAMLYINTDTYQGDYNNYYSPFDIAIASYSFDPLATFADMQSVFGNVEEHSTVHHPAYISEQDLHLSANSPLIDAASQTYFGINHDIDGDNRTVSPDIGADEFDGATCVTDYAFIDKTICAGESFEGYNELGIYTDTLPSFNGCDSIRTLYLTVLPEIMLSVELDEVAGTAMLQVQGGTAPYDITWNDGQVGDMATNLITGTYNVTLTDANDCQEILTFDITTTSIQNDANNLAFQLSPNPSQGQLQVSIELEQNHVIHGKILDITGQVLKTYEWKGSMIQESLDLFDLPKGMYLMYLQSEENLGIRRFILE